SFDDDGILIRLLETTEPPPMAALFRLTAVEIEQLLVQALPQAPVFAVHFRYNAARALLLPRSQAGKRIPLWLQRLRATDLQQAVCDDADFPVLVETYRECLQDVFDLPALKTVIEAIHHGRIRIDFVNTSYPSPMAAGILFKFVSVYLYELDQSRRPARPLSVSSELLDIILEPETIPTILPPRLVDQAEKRWQHLDAETQAASAEELFSIIEKLGPIAEKELRLRSRRDPLPWLDELQAARRIVFFQPANINPSHAFWSVAEETVVSIQADDQDRIVKRLERYLRTRGPVTVAMLADRLNLPLSSITDALQQLHQQNKVVRGRLIIGRKEEQWCHRHNFLQLYRTAVARRRIVQKPADRLTFNRFLLQWHHIAQPGQCLKDVIRRYRGFRFPLYFFERAVFGSRYQPLTVPVFKEKQTELNTLISEGEIIVHSGRNRDSGRRWLDFRLRGEGNLFSDAQTLRSAVDDLSPPARTVFDFLQENGTSYVRDLELATDLTQLQLQGALQQLAEKGLASCENYPSFLGILQSLSNQRAADDANDSIPHSTPRWARQRHRRRPKRALLRQAIQQGAQIRDARWFLTTSFAVMGKRLSDSQRATLQARLLLNRYGILVKEWYRREAGLLPWYRIFQMLKRLEWQGEIRRGYFVQGLSGVQFALPEAVDLLDKISRHPPPADGHTVLLSSLDPALPYGGSVAWNLKDALGIPLKVVRSAANHLVLVEGKAVMYSENFFERLWLIDESSPAILASSAELLSGWLKLPHSLKPKKRIEIHEINNRPASSHPFAEHLVRAGFEKNEDKLTLWPSAV
ncbi:MAG: hypothetical protein JSW26_17175, partial [Desulfobacterales bacterium]